MTENLPLYTCHKQVRGFKIAHITPQALGTYHDNIPEIQYQDVPFEHGTERLPIPQKTEYVLVDKTGDHVAVVGDDYFMKHMPKIGGYFVRYEDGYESFSPADAFEGGYTIAEEKKVIVIRVGNDNWSPKTHDLKSVVELFRNATLDPDGAVVAVNYGINLSVEQVLRTETDNMYVCHIDSQHDMKTLLQNAREEK